MPSRDGQLGLDLLIDVPSWGSRRKSVEHAIRAAIQQGRLRAGDRLPSSRELAGQLGLARGTVNDAYTHLAAEGWLTAHTGAGTRVADRVGTELASTAPDPLAGWLPRHDLSPGRPDISSFPRAAWSKAIRQVILDAPTEAFGYSDPRGRIELRTALASYLARVRGVRVAPEHLVICSGYTQALGLLAQVFAREGVHVIGMENPAMGDHVAIVSARLAVADVPVDAEGMRVDELARTGAEVAVCTPAHQFPSGVGMSAARRAELVSWARDTKAWVVEDDYDGEFRYERQPMSAVQAKLASHTIYVGSTSKSLGPAVRLGWIASPPALLRSLAEAKRLADRQTSPLDQLAFAGFITSGEYDRYLVGARRAYRKRRDQLSASIRSRLPGATLLGVAAGLHAILELPPGAPPESEVLAALRSESVRVHAFSDYLRDSGRPAGTRLVLGYATPPAHGYSATVAALFDVLTRLCARA